MKHPKHRTTIYVIVREAFDEIDQTSNFITLDSFRSYERAEEVVETYRKDAKDRGLGLTLFYEVEASTYYNE